MENKQLFTVGHSSQSAEEFLQLIQPHGINCILDVRSTPYSKYTPQFNEDIIKQFLNTHGVLYVPFGKHFGARRTDCLQEHLFKKKGKKEVKLQVDFEKGVTTMDFQTGVERLNNAISQGRRVALMCSEADALGCHRFSFIARYFYDLGWDVFHILKNSDNGESIAIPHKALEQRMIWDYINCPHPKLKSVGKQSGGLFSDFGDGYDEKAQRIDAYKLKNLEIGWISDSQDNETNYY